jgi:hypothetical protein
MTLTNEIPMFTGKCIGIDDINGFIWHPGDPMWEWNTENYKDTSHYSDNEIDVREFKGSIYD